MTNLTSCISLILGRYACPHCFKAEIEILFILSKLIFFLSVRLHSKNVISSTTDYSTKVVCSVEKENLFGTQFHPEKSDRIGLKIIDNFINL